MMKLSTIGFMRKTATLFLLIGAPARADIVACRDAYLKSQSRSSVTNQLDDYHEAISECTPLAKAGNAEAQYRLGLMYELGRGVRQDYQEAVRWYKLAAAQSIASAQSALAMMYYRGQGVPMDDREAAHWFGLAAEQGLVSAQSIIGLLYFTGQGVPQDYVLAHKWLNLAAAAGGDDGVKNRDMAAANMTPAQIADAQRLAREWKPKKAN